ncbi:MAG TPA: FtsX-like permease family protein [Smithella sp.]|nr:FtsX-like permease family protein [Smithella sp.]
MMNWMKLAFRNILRNKRRSFVTMVAIGVGFAAIGLYHGYIHNAYAGLRVIAIRGEGLGHLRINKAGWNAKGKLEPEKYMFTREETEKIMKLVGEEKEVVLSTPQMQVVGTVTNGATSTVFIAQGVVPKDEVIIKGDWVVFKPRAGHKISDDVLYGVEMAKDLAAYLNMNAGSNGIVMAQTLAGQVNALDMQVSGVYDTGNDFSNDKFMRFNFKFAQSLLDTQSAERVVVLLKEWEDTEMMRDRLLKKLKAAGIDCEIRTWKELSLGYLKMKSYLDMIFIFIASIVLGIVIMTTINTMGMAILERTKEIGTLRALGLKVKGVSLLFTLEGALLGFLGSIVGILLHIVVWVIIRLFPPHYVPPGFSEPVPMFIDMVPWMLLLLVFCFIILSMIAAIIPARGAARKNIVDALGHV